MDKRRGALIGGGLCVGWSLGMVLGAALLQNPLSGCWIELAAGGAIGGFWGRKT